MYRYTVHNVKDSGELQPPAVGWSLHSAVYAPPDRLVCVWVADGRHLTDDEWGQSTWALRDINDPITIEG